jgi:transcriptional regulator with XRE-family HTH domain
MKVYLKDSKQLGHDIKMFRMRHHWSQAELGKQLNVSAQAISNWERGETYMSLDIIVQLSSLMGISLDDFLLYDIHGDYSYATIFDRLRLREFWVDIVDLKKVPETGEILIDLRVQYDRYSFFVDEIFSLQLGNEKDQEVSSISYGWIEDTSVNGSPAAQEISRVYRIGYRQVHQPTVLVIQYNSYHKHIRLQDSLIESVIKGQLSPTLYEEDSLLQQRIIEFYMKTNKVDRLMKFMQQMELSDHA